MSRVFQVVALLLVALWVPATSHCRLEEIGFQTLFSCADASGPGEADDGDCAGDSCHAVESGDFAFSKSEFAFAILAAPEHDCFACLLDAPPPEAAVEFLPARGDESLPAQRTWQFTRRAAAPPRAPDALNA